MAKILLVDDQTCIQHFYQEELTACGYNVTVASDGYEAIAKMEAFKPDVVVLDLFLEGPKGWEVLDIIKNRDVCLPVIIITAYDSYRDDPRLKKADGYVIKSFNLTELKQKISEIFKYQQEEDPLLKADNNTLLKQKLVTV
jgi:DNA-binding response OmpR family regulator